MEYPQPLSNIKCAACGAAVQIAPGSTTAVCVYCGNHQLVHPSIPVANQVAHIGNSVGNVDRSTARLAAEMALPRLSAERQQCLAYYIHLYTLRSDEMTQRKLAALIITPIVGGILSIGFVLQHPVLGLLVFMAGIGAGGYLCYRIWRHYNRFGSTYDPQLKATLAQLQSIDARIADNYRIVNS